MPQEQHILLFNRSLTIDHKDGQGRNSLNPNNSIDNLITLCKQCNIRANYNRNYWIDLFKEKIKCLIKN